MEITKEVVLESNINTRIGELLSLETLTKGRIAKFHVEATAKRPHSIIKRSCQFRTNG